MPKTFFLPVNTGYYTNGIPTQECLRFYAQRSNSETYCAIVGNVATQAGFGSNSSTGKISKHSLWRQLSNSILQNGSKPGIQLANSWDGYQGQEGFINPNWDVSLSDVRKQLKQLDLNAIFGDLQNSIELAIEHGFEHIQIHAAHGYLLSSLIDPQINDHAVDVISHLGEICDYLNKRIESSIRLSIYCGLSDEVEMARMDIIKKILSLSFDFFDLSEGYYNFDKNYIYPNTIAHQEARLSRYLKVVTDYPEKQFIVSGIWKIGAQTPENTHLGYCRNIIADPKFLLHKNASCKLCGGCHYHSRGRQKLNCTLWN